jgi:molybdopterin converting factor small subunit
MQVLVFAALRDLAGSGLVETTARDVGGMLEELTGRYGPEFGRIASAGSVVVDGRRASPDEPLHPGQEVAILPPVSGGSPVPG